MHQQDKPHRLPQVLLVPKQANFACSIEHMLGTRWMGGLSVTRPSDRYSQGYSVVNGSCSTAFFSQGISEYRGVRTKTL